jgi:hypothetical protein
MLVTTLTGCGNKGGANGKIKATLEPSSGQQGVTMDVKIVGSGSHFVDGNTELQFSSDDPTSPDIEVNSTTVTNATHAVANITIRADAKTGSRGAAVATTQPKWESAASTFTVLPLK